MNFSTYLILLTFLFPRLSFTQNLIDYYDLAMDNFNQNNYSVAMQHFNKIISSDDVDEKLLSSSKIYTAECLLGLDQKDGAISKFEYFINEYPTSNYRELALYRLGNLYFEKKLYDKSRTNLVELVNVYPSSSFAGSAYHLIGETFIEENNLDKAESFFSSAVDSKQKNSLVDQSIYSLANLYEKKGQYTDAVNYYDKLLGFHKESELSSLAQFRIGVCYFYLEEYDNAVLELSDPIIKNLDTDQINEADYILANSFYRLKEYDNASDAYRRILNNSPSSQMLDRIRYGLAWIHFQKGNYNDAYKMFNLLAKSSDDSIAVKSLYWSGEAKRYDGKYGESIEIHKQFVDTYPNHHYTEKVRLNIGISKFSQNSYSESEDALLESINSSDQLTKTKSLTLLGEINLRKNNYKSAKDFFIRGLAIPQIPKELDDRCNLGLGVANFFLKNSVEALNNLNEIDEKLTKVDRDKLNFYKGEVNFFLGNFSDAAQNFDNVSTKDERILENSIYGKAYSHFNLKNFNKAAFFFSEYIKEFKNGDHYYECQLRLADCYYGTKSFGKASSYYKQVLINSNKFANDERSYFNYAQSLFKDGKANNAINILVDIQAKFPSSKYADQSQYLIGWINFQRGKFDEAINDYNNLFSNYPKSTLLPIAYYSIGDCYFNQGQYDKAIKSYNLLITQYPSSQYVYDAVNGIQYCYIIQERQTEAISYLDNFIKRNKESDFLDKIQFKKAEIYYSSANYGAAFTEYEKVIDEYSDSPLKSSSHYWIGKSAINLNKNEDAIDNFESVINNSLNTEVGFNSVIELGRIYRKQKLYDEEIKLYDEILPDISDSKRVSEIKFIKAKGLIENNNVPSAYNTLVEIVDSREGSLFYYKSEIELGILELSRANYDNSLYLFNDVVKNREDDIAAQAQYFIGLSYYEQEKLPKAITELIKARSLYSAYDEWYSKSLLLLGDSYVKINDKAKAAEMFKSVLKRHRNNELADEANEKLNLL